jgi:formate/nitrite transporter FocA (FNT family)
MNPIASLFTKDVLRHPLVLLSLLAVALIALGSGLYYVVETQSPKAQWATATMGPTE